MCGRYSLTRRQQEISERFGLEQLLDEFKPRFNISPTQNVPVIVQEEEQKIITPYRWGLIPSWVKDLKTARQIINSRSETILEKPFFKRLVTKKRCLIPADGFYEWKQGANPKQKIPMWIHLVDKSLFAFAGIYDEWKSEEKNFRSYSIITCAANDVVAPVHDRMPVILPRELEDKWLDPEFKDPDEIVKMLVPYPNELVTMYQVSSDVNSAKTDQPHMTDQVEEGAPDVAPDEPDSGQLKLQL